MTDTTLTRRTFGTASVLGALGLAGCIGNDDLIDTEVVGEYIHEGISLDEPATLNISARNEEADPLPLNVHIYHDPEVGMTAEAMQSEDQDPVASVENIENEEIEETVDVDAGNLGVIARGDGHLTIMLE